MRVRQAGREAERQRGTQRLGLKMARKPSFAAEAPSSICCSKEGKKCEGRFKHCHSPSRLPGRRRLPASRHHVVTLKRLQERLKVQKEIWLLFPFQGSFEPPSSTSENISPALSYKMSSAYICQGRWCRWSMPATQQFIHQLLRLLSLNIRSICNSALYNQTCFTNAAGRLFTHHTYLWGGLKPWPNASG